MRIEELLRRKGGSVATIRPAASVSDALAELARLNIGALVVSSDEKSPDGILSERDVVRRLNDKGAAILDGPVSSIMSTTVRCCSPDNEVESVMATMTEFRIRHVPVLRDGALVGIVSIGDVVKTRIDDLEQERRSLVDYIYAR
jgi:CBS domain-containing protein